MIYCLLSVRNEEKLLQGFFDHLRDYVSGFLVINDASTDNSEQIILSEKKLVFYEKNEQSSSTFNKESLNRFKLITAARKFNAQWLIGADADFRFQTRFLTNLINVAYLAEKKNCPVVNLWLRELWDSYDQFRVDGFWNSKTRHCYFKCPYFAFKPRPSGVLHLPWYPEPYDKENVYKVDYNVYHLGMIREEDRIARINKFHQLDGENGNGGHGYRYLNDKTNLTLQKVTKALEYKL